MAGKKQRLLTTGSTNKLCQNENKISHSVNSSYSDALLLGQETAIVYSALKKGDEDEKLEDTSESIKIDYPTRKSLPAMTHVNTPWYVEYGTQVLLLLAVILVSLQTSIIKRLTDMGGACRNNGEDKQLSVYNILTYGNFISSTFMLIIFSPRLWKFKRLTACQWFACTIGALLYSALSNCLLFVALEYTTQNNVAIITRLEPTFIMALSAIAFRSKKHTWNEIIPCIIVTIGIIAMYCFPLTEGDTITFSQGELAALGSAICISLSTVVSKAILNKVPLGVFVVYRGFLGAGLFLVFGMILDEIDHVVVPWQDDICPEFIGLIVGWAVLICFTQLFWFAAVQSATSDQISLAIAIGFPTLLASAYLINGEIPTKSQWIGSGFIMVAILYSNVTDCWGQKGHLESTVLPGSDAPQGDWDNLPGRWNYGMMGSIASGKSIAQSIVLARESLLHYMADTMASEERVMTSMGSRAW